MGYDSSEFGGCPPRRPHRPGQRPAVQSVWTDAMPEFVIASALPLAAGISGDLLVAVAVALQNTTAGIVVGLFALLGLVVLWFVQPLVLRRRVSD